MKPLLIKGGQIIDPSQGIDIYGNLLIADGKINSLNAEYPGTTGSGYEVLNAGGLIVCPGFIDFHCHLRQPGFEEKETIASGSRAAARGGFTTICCMPNTSPPLDNRAIIDYVKTTAASEGVVRVLPFGCITRGRRGEELTDMGELAQAGVVAFSDDGNTVMNSHLMCRAMEHSLALGLPISDHCEDTTLSSGGQVNEGVTAIKLGLRGIPAAAEDSIIARDIALAQQTGTRIHIAHVSTAGSVELLRRAKDRGIKVTAEVTPHHLTLTQESVLGYNTNAKVNPPLRTEKDINALVRGLNEGIIDIIATDHAPHTEEDKRREFALAPFGISGLETALGILMKLAHDGKLELKLLIAKLTSEPARIIGDRFGKLGTLEVGSLADVTIFDPYLEWTVDTKEFASKGKNTPLKGKRLKGKVMATIYQGKLVYKYDSIKIEVK
jgi:dihydroorotase